jgi:2-hydroxyacyl-CoA lyase 1
MINTDIRVAATSSLDGHTLVAQTLRCLGITHVFGVSGTPIRETFAYCAKAGIRTIGARHQQAAVLMATAQNYVAGKLVAIALVSAGPAVTNTVTGVLVARDNAWPVLVLGGRRPLTMQGMGSFQDLDALPIFASITKWSALVDKVEKIPEYLTYASRIAMTGRPGPVYLDLPEDVLTAFSSNDCVTQPLNAETTPFDSASITMAAEALLTAERPAMIIGKGVRWSEAYLTVTRLIDTFNIPFMASPMGRGYLSDQHRCCFNEARTLLQSKADVILIAGARLDWTFRFGSEFARDARVIQVDIHEPEIGINRQPYAGIVGDLKTILDGLFDEMSRRKHSYQAERLVPWHAELQSAKSEKLAAYAKRASTETLPMSPHRMLREVGEFLPREAMVVLDGNVFMAAAQQILPCCVPVSRLTAGTNGCMGVGIPFAIGAKLAEPGRMVLAICGDTAFAFNSMEMETAVRHKIPILIIVVNNDGNSGGLIQKALYPAEFERITMFEPGIHYEQIMRAFGGHGECVDAPEQMKPALDRSVRCGAAACINVRVDPYAPYPAD